jgi:hypothetical protein
MSSYPSTSSGRTGLEQYCEELSAAFTSEPAELSGRTGENKKGTSLKKFLFYQFNRYYSI